jgi:hypothetical protein
MGHHIYAHGVSYIDTCIYRHHTCVHAYIHTYKGGSAAASQSIQACMHPHIAHTHIYTHIHNTYTIHTCMHTYRRFCGDESVHTYIHTYIHTCRHTHIIYASYTHTYIHTYIHIHTHIYAYIYIYRRFCGDESVHMIRNILRLSHANNYNSSNKGHEQNMQISNHDHNNNNNYNNHNNNNKGNGGSPRENDLFQSINDHGQIGTVTGQTKSKFWTSPEKM